MPLDYFDLRNMRRHHPAWRLMSADSAPLIAGFLDLAFRDQNHRSIPEAELTTRLEDYLYTLRDNYSDQDPEQDPFPRKAGEYLDDWAHIEKGWLRKYYPPGSDEAHYDLTPATETALRWLDSLFERGFVGTESRLQTIVQLLREISSGVETDKDKRIRELEAQRRSLKAEIDSIKNGSLRLMDGRALRERYFQVNRMARELLGDFRAVEHNFRQLDRDVRQQIAAWTGGKHQMLQTIFGEHDAITQSDQGQSFRSFWDFLMSPASQDELTELLDRLYSLEALEDETHNDPRLRRIHFDWMAAGEQTQRTVARLSRQLRNYLDDRAYYENRRIIELHENLEALALTVRHRIPPGDFMELPDSKPDVRLPLERPLFQPPVSTDLTTLIQKADLEQLDSSALFDQIVVDKARLRRTIKSALESESQISLGVIIHRHPLTEGLAELVGYLSVAAEDGRAHIDEETVEEVSWQDRQGRQRTAKIPLVLFI